MLRDGPISVCDLRPVVYRVPMGTTGARPHRAQRRCIQVPRLGVVALHHLHQYAVCWRSQVQVRAEGHPGAAVGLSCVLPHLYPCSSPRAVWGAGRATFAREKSSDRAERCQERNKNAKANQPEQTCPGCPGQKMQEGEGLGLRVLLASSVIRVEANAKTR